MQALQFVLAGTLVAPLLACGGEHYMDPTALECGPPTVVDEDWQRPFTPLAVATGSAVHSGIDVIVAPNEAFTLEGKFAYGPTSKDLQSERVTAFLELDQQGCGWIVAGTASTDSDGRARIDVPADILEEPGMYRFRFVVHGDLSEAQARVWVLAPATKAVIFDIDGTLTTSDLELVGDAVVFTVGATSEVVFDLGGSPLSKSQWMFGLERLVDEPEAYEGAFDVVHHYAEQDILPIYVTGRAYLFDEITRAWLGAHVPAGPLMMTRSVSDSMPKNVVDYKRRSIEDLVEGYGIRIEAAYGNADSDVCAYAQAGIGEDRTFIIGDQGGTACDGFAATQRINSYVDHLTGLPR